MHSSIAHRLLWGLVIVTIGVVFLLNQTGIITISIGDLFSHYWPVLMIVFGLQGLLLQSGGAYWWNLLVVIIGFMFLGRNMGWMEWDFSDIIRLIGPIAIILIGINMIFRGNRPRKRDKHENGEQWNPITPPIPPVPPMPPGPPPAPPEWDEFERELSGAANKQIDPAAESTSANSTFEQQSSPRTNAQFYGWKQRHEHKDWWKAHDWSNPNRDNHSRFIGDVQLGKDYWELRPMSISHFIGDTTLDLTKAQIPIGETRIYVSSFIGDVKVYVPNDLGVGIQVISSCLIGDVKVLDQKRGGIFNQMSVETPSYSDADKRVVLVVSSFIGDVRVTKVG
ncbi:cell wall-active antibiotics response protein LiaF [Cohnella silvisoli]|uniref:Cell wall-active antibiotics response protein LiaF n=1 Tax=Cohnella silvisoli TaxID=2873699 RepID=A0ABV1L4I3_9BACL|nr:cell wall-active antibiotics response protein LiaF [Cohnella silvisoli]MCD9026495.1 cell wall-active antibiotics response protein [Cohnella silvisoli]